MGLSFYTCHNCGGISVNECIRCNENCDNRWCSEGCAEAEGWCTTEGEEEDDECWSNYTCSFCRDEEVEDYQLFKFALKKLGLSRDTLQKECLST